MQIIQPHTKWVRSFSCTEGNELVPMIAKEWSLATGMALLAWFIFAPQCISTLAAARRETGGWGIPAAILIYLFALAYLASWLTYRISLYLFH